jgi:hypothetical protein
MAKQSSSMSISMLTIKLLTMFILFGSSHHCCSAYQVPTAKWTKKIKRGYEQRVAADPSFAAKSVTEVLLAAGTQLSAEWNRRGAHRLLPEIDFVFPAMVAAVVGKYYRYVHTYARHKTRGRYVMLCTIIVSPESMSNFWASQDPTAVQSRFLWNTNVGFGFW